ncbi:MAG: permease [Alphaproteobacteria bacterium]|nr:permease [Alphaproteobacteria bacterium]
MSQVASLTWFARHELNLAWRDWIGLMSGGRKLRDRAVLIGMGIFALALHGVAYAVLSPFFKAGGTIDLAALVMLTGMLVLTFTMMLSQAMESVTRAFYSRDDLDLILSSPASSRDLFAVRIAMMALTTAGMSGLMVAPFINVAALMGGPQWLAGYGVVLAISLCATGGAVLIALALFRTVGAKRTRLVAQIAAAVVGASFLIGIQVVAIVSYGSMSRWSVINSDTVINNVPGMDSLLWLPAAAVSGHLGALIIVLAAAAGFFVLAARTGAIQFQRIVVSALSVATGNVQQKRGNKTFRATSTHRALMQKEWVLLGRDPWLISQTLMQVLYLIPPALMLWVNFGEDAHLSAILAPVVVMAIGQLAGGLAWLTISGEDAPDLVATAPVAPWAVMAAKVQAVLIVVLAIVAPLVLGIAALSMWGAAVTFVGALVAALSAIVIQLWFRAQSKRTNFRRRQVASKASTFCEAFASISCAGTASLAAAGNLIAVVPGLLLVIVMVVAWLLSPPRS